MPKFLISTNWQFFSPDKGKLELPKKPKKLNDCFDDFAKEIREIFTMVHKENDKLRTANKKILPPMHSPKGLFNQLVYQLGNDCSVHKRKKWKKFLIKQIEGKGGRILPSQPGQGGNNIFFLWFRALEHEELITKGPDISKRSRQLFYAHECRVSAEDLSGFIYQTGGGLPTNKNTYKTKHSSHQSTNDNWDE